MRPWVALLLILLLPGAAATSTLSVETDHPVGLRGTLDVAMPGANLYLREDGTGSLEIAGVTGEATLWTWRALRATTGQDGANVTRQIGDASAQRYALSNATIRFSYQDAPFDLVAIMDTDGVAGVMGDIDASGLPRVVAASGGARAAAIAGPQQPPEDVSWSTQAG